MSEWEKAGIVGVDSGQLMVVDPTYIDSEWVKLNAPYYGQLNYRMGHPGVAVAFSSGWGDGVYEVQVRKVDGRIAEARIIMIDENEEDEFL